MRNLYSQQTEVHLIPTDRAYWLGVITPGQAGMLAREVIGYHWESLSDGFRLNLLKVLSAGQWRLRGVRENNPTLFLLPSKGRISVNLPHNCREVCVHGIMLNRDSVHEVVIKTAKRPLILDEGISPICNVGNKLWFNPLLIRANILASFAAEAHNAQVVRNWQNNGELGGIVKPLFIEQAPYALVAYEACKFGQKLAPTLEQVDFQSDFLAGIRCWINTGFSLADIHQHNLAHGDFRGAQVCVTDSNIPKIIDLEPMIETQKQVFLVQLKDAWFLEQYITRKHFPIVRACNHDFYDWGKVCQLSTSFLVNSHRVEISGSDVQSADIKAFALAFLDFLFAMPKPEDINRYATKPSSVAVLKNYPSFVGKLTRCGFLLQAELAIEEMVQIAYQLCIIPDNLRYFLPALNKLRALQAKMQTMVSQ